MNLIYVTSQLHFARSLALVPQYLCTKATHTQDALDLVTIQLAGAAIRTRGKKKTPRDNLFKTDFSIFERKIQQYIK